MIHQISNSVGNYNFNAYIYSGMRFYLHFHKNYELIYVLRGECDVWAYGQKIEMKMSQFFLIAPNEPHSFAVSDTSEIWVGVFSSDYIRPAAERCTHVGYFPFSCDATAQAYLDKYLLRVENPPFFDRISTLNVVCAQCAQNAEPIKTYTHTEISNKIVAYIYEHYTEEITLRSTAEHLGYEYHYFSGVFHRLFNMDFRDFVNACRFERACELLYESDLPLSQVSIESGFGSLRNFNRVFKSYSAMTPQSFRKRSRWRRI